MGNLPLIISIASGKGGTGKTLVATSIASSLGSGVELVDCDVEEPNSYLFFPKRIKEKSEKFSLPVPVIDEEKCKRCGICSDFCAYNALAVFPQEVLLFKELCHGCGGCTLACPEQAISEGKRSIGSINRAKASDINLLWGELNIGEPMASPLIRAVKKEASADLVIIDSPPGTACPMMEAALGSDFCLLVTEPTPFGLYDLNLAACVLEKMNIPCGILLNKSGSWDAAIYNYSEEKDLPVLMEIPMDRKIAELYSRGIIFIDQMPEWRDRFIELIEGIEEIIT
jgi:MinD superfamily P-loop ATPase